MDQESISNLQEALRQIEVREDAPDISEPISFEGLWPDHVVIVEAFAVIAKQWRVVSVGGGIAPSFLMWIGLDYSAVRVALDALEFKVTPDLWSGLQVMEEAACAALNKARF